MMSASESTPNVPQTGGEEPTTTATTTESVLVTIPEVKISHVIGSASVPLSSGDLTLTTFPSSKDPNVLILQVGQSAFTIAPTTSPFSTHAHDPTIYAFPAPSPDSTDSTAPSSASSDPVPSNPLLSPTGYIEIVLPLGVKAVGSKEEKSRNKFEDELVKRGFLKEGLEAAAGDLASWISGRVRSTGIGQPAQEVSTA